MLRRTAYPPMNTGCLPHFLLQLERDLPQPAHVSLFIPSCLNTPSRPLPLPPTDTARALRHDAGEARAHLTRHGCCLGYPAAAALMD